MKKIASLLFVFFSVIATTFAQEQTTITRFEGKKITGIEAHGLFDITVKQGSTTGATVNIPARLEKQLVFKLDSDGKLQIYLDWKTTSKKERKNKGNKNEKFTAEITLTSLENIELSGVCKLETIGNFTTNQLKIDLSGATKVFINDNFLVKEGLIVNMSGATSVKGQITCQKSIFDISGASTLNLKGNTSRCTLDASGASKIFLEEFPINTLKAELSGASKGHFQVKEEISISTSGASKATYIGDPKILSQESSGASNINKIVKNSSETKKEYQK